MTSTRGAQTYMVKCCGAVIAAYVVVQILLGFLRAANLTLFSPLTYPSLVC